MVAASCNDESRALYGYLTIRRKTFAVGQRTVKTVKVFLLQCVAIYGIR